MSKRFKLEFYNNTDTVDIDAKCLGISSNASINDSGLNIQIRHNGSKYLFNLANKMSKVIIDALNKEGIAVELLDEN